MSGAWAAELGESLSLKAPHRCVHCIAIEFENKQEEKQL
jgi:hypothetical protein